MDNYDDQSLYEQRMRAKSNSEHHYKENSKKRLLNSLDRKFKTTMIGALAQFEEAFGELWGHGKDQSKLTAQEEDARQLWDQTRTSILNNGNNQLRAAHEEIAQYTLSWNRYKTDFIVVKKDGN